MSASKPNLCSNANEAKKACRYPSPEPQLQLLDVSSPNRPSFFFVKSCPRIGALGNAAETALEI